MCSEVPLKKDLELLILLFFTSLPLDMWRLSESSCVASIMGKNREWLVVIMWTVAMGNSSLEVSGVPYMTSISVVNVPKKLGSRYRYLRVEFCHKF